ncbi:DUF4185 domain-containing protein [Nannocystaceae bacterium ST9]
MFVTLALCGCRQADLIVVEAERIGTVPRSEWIQGRDGGGSNHAFGKSIWVYGDTVLNDVDEDGTNWHTNSYDIADPSTWMTGMIGMTGFETPVDGVGAPRFFVELTDEEKAWNDLHAAEDCPEAPCHVRWALWPSAPLFDESRQRAWILYGLYNDELPSGIGIASWDGLDQPVVRHEIDGSWLLFPAPEIEWAAAPVVHADWLYSFGCQLRGLSRPCMLARAPLEDPTDRAAWRFWDGEGWSKSADDADELFDGAPIMEVAWNPALDRWLLVYSKPFDHDVVARTAEYLQGPWSREEVLFRAPGEAPYDAVHHADLQEQDGLVQYITYSQPTTGWFGSEHMLWRVELARP